MVGKLAAAALITGAIVVQPAPLLAQSVLERVLGQLDGATNLAPVNGTYANIAENVSTNLVTSTSSPLGLLDAADDTVIFTVQIDGEGGPVDITVADLGTTIDVDGLGFANLTISPDGSITAADYPGDGVSDTVLIYDAAGNLLFSIVDTSADPTATVDFSTYALFESKGQQYLSTVPEALDAGFVQVFSTSTSVTNISSRIDGSITNVITGVTKATAEATAKATSATEITLPSINFGNIATTALGAVNTGDITLGVNSAVDDAATSTTAAISAAMTQIGGSADTGALVLNVASNASAVQGNVKSVLVAVNGSVGNINTTALGAVNTGTITSGLNAAVQGIIGAAGQN
ncbi:MAG: hypothetical protein R3D65_05670 [Zhengella sp.]|uniref:hypothetical protein n=1 Tax=Zhengella sp. TaxID=2282762 RepID=UPI003526F2A4